MYAGADKSQNIGARTTGSDEPPTVVLGTELGCSGRAVNILPVTELSLQLHRFL